MERSITNTQKVKMVNNDRHADIGGREIVNNDDRDDPTDIRKVKYIRGFL